MRQNNVVHLYSNKHYFQQKAATLAVYTDPINLAKEIEKEMIQAYIMGAQCFLGRLSSIDLRIEDD